MPAEILQHLRQFARQPFALFDVDLGLDAPQQLIDDRLVFLPAGALLSALQPDLPQQSLPVVAQEARNGRRHVGAQAEGVDRLAARQICLIALLQALDQRAVACRRLRGGVVAAGDQLVEFADIARQHLRIVDIFGAHARGDLLDDRAQRMPGRNVERQANRGTRHLVEQLARRMGIGREEITIEHDRPQGRNLQAGERRLDRVGQGW